MAEEGEVGGASHPPGGYSAGMFNDVSSVDDFAALIGVPKAAMELVVPLDKKCKSRDCPFKAIDGNGNQCPAHRRTYYSLLD